MQMNQLFELDLLCELCAFARTALSPSRRQTEISRKGARATKKSCARLLIGLAVVMATCLSVRPQFAELRLKRPQQHINDFAGVLDSSSGIRMENVLANLQDRAGINFVVVTVKTAGEQDLYDLAFDLANEWKLGSQASEQKSLLLLVA